MHHRALLLVLMVACNAGQVTSADVDDPSEEGPEADPAIRPGPWRAVSADIEGDPCPFDAYLSSYAYSTLAYLPSQFEVEAASGGFLIEATPYNVVRGPIFCALEEAQFTCETQFVQAYDSVYEIDFAGERVSDETIRGTAVVRFEFDGETEALLTDAGFTVADCDHTIDLELQYGRF